MGDDIRTISLFMFVMLVAILALFAAWSVLLLSALIAIFISKSNHNNFYFYNARRSVAICIIFTTTVTVLLAMASAFSYIMLKFNLDKSVTINYVSFGADVGGFWLNLTISMLLSYFLLYKEIIPIFLIPVFISINIFLIAFFKAQFMIEDDMIINFVGISIFEWISNIYTSILWSYDVIRYSNIPFSECCSGEHWNVFIMEDYIPVVAIVFYVINQIYTIIKKSLYTPEISYRVSESEVSELYEYFCGLIITLFILIAPIYYLSRFKLNDYEYSLVYYVINIAVWGFLIAALFAVGLIIYMLFTSLLEIWTRGIEGTQEII